LAIELAESNIRKTEVRRDRILRARKRLDDILAARGEDITASDILVDLDLDERVEAVLNALQGARFASEGAKIKKEILEKYDSRKRILELMSAAKRAKAVELRMQATWELEKSKQAKLQRQVDACEIVAPIDGVVVYANDTNRFDGSSQPQIEEGAIVRGRQKIFSIPDLSGPMRLNVKVPESLIEWLRPGLRARIKIEGLADAALPGFVEEIAPHPDPATTFNRDTKVYSTYVSPELVPEGLTLGMAARVEILTSELENVLSLPVASVVYYDQKDHVAVKKSDGGFEWRDVILGLSNGTLVEVKQGLTSGESVASEPASLLSGGQKLKISHSPPKPMPAANPALRRAKATTRPSPPQ
jgi:HlyD family secretion protein